jgi:hypothetical protein
MFNKMKNDPNTEHPHTLHDHYKLENFPTWWEVSTSNLSYIPYYLHHFTTNLTIVGKPSFFENYILKYKNRYGKNQIPLNPGLLNL